MEIIYLKIIPDHYQHITRDVATNYDHTINHEVADELMNGNYWAQYSGWDFCGYVWYDKEEKKWCCEVWTYHVHRETVEADTLEAIMKTVSESYGYD